jgi:hypothetical protein
VATPATLARHLPLDLIWERVVVPLIAEPNDFVQGNTAPTAADTTAADTQADQSEKEGPVARADAPDAHKGDASEKEELAKAESGDGDAKQGADSKGDVQATKAEAKVTREASETAPEDVDIADFSQIDEVEEDELVEAVDSDEGFEEILDEELSEPPPAGPSVKQAVGGDASKKDNGSLKGPRKLGLRS